MTARRLATKWRLLVMTLCPLAARGRLVAMTARPLATTWRRRAMTVRTLAKTLATVVRTARRIWRIRRAPGKHPRMSERIVHCRLLKKDLPGLDRPPYRNELGQKLFAEVSKEAWQKWLQDSVRFVNTYRVDLASPEGQKFMLKQCSIYFGYESGDAAPTAWTAPEEAAKK